MIRAFFTVITCLLTAAIQAQTPAWIWAKSAGSAGTDNAFSIAAHSSGNTYVTGQFGAGSIAFGNTTLSNAGSLDIFIVKYDASGAVLWAKSAGGKGFDGGYGIAADSIGNCYVTGSFEDTISFGNVTLTAAGGADIFVAKYDAAGNLLWAKSAGGAMIDGGSSIAVDRMGNSYVTGYYSGNFMFGSAGLTNSGYEDLFIAKYDPSGAVLWAKGIGGSGKDISTDIATDKAGNVYLTGWYNSMSLNFSGNTISNTGQNDIFIARLDPSGTVLWVKGAGGAGSDQSLSIAVDGGNNSVITGYYTNSSISFGASTLANSGGHDIFIARYDSTGAALWAKSSGGSKNDLGYAVATDAYGYSYITGWFLSSSISFGSTTLNNAGAWPYSDLFVTKFDRSGNVVWAQSAGDVGMDVANCIDVDGKGACYITGTFNTTIRFGATALNMVRGSALFVAKMSAGETGIKEAATLAGYKVFPNPVSDQLHISCDKPGNEQQTLEVYDCTGRLMMRKGLSSMQSAIDVRQWPAGLYGIRIGGEWLPVVKQ